MFMRVDRILQNFCGTPEANGALQHLEIKIMISFG